MKTKKIEDIKNKLIKLKPILRKKFKIKKIGLFGSYVKGTQNKKSDCDILVEFYETPDLFTYIEIEEFLSKQLNVKVDLVMKSALKPYIGKIILQEVQYI